MGRKNRMKSTFQNSVCPGSFWIRHNEYNILKAVGTFELMRMEKDDVVIVMGLVSPHNINIIKDVKLVQCYSQKMNCIYTTDLEKFYFNYHKL